MIRSSPAYSRKKNSGCICEFHAAACLVVLLDLIN
jgi:hypothetical protein